MTDPDKPETHETQASEQASEPADVTAAYQPGIAGEELVRVLDQYLADLEAGCATTREKLLAEHPGLGFPVGAVPFRHRVHSSRGPTGGGFPIATGRLRDHRRGRPRRHGRGL